MSDFAPDRYVREHRALERLGGELRLAAVRRDAPLARARASELAAELQRHVRREHEDLAAIFAAVDDASVREAGLAHTRAAQDVVGEATGLAATWSTSQKVADDFDGFRADLEHLLVAIGLWIHGEERRLFPMVERLDHPSLPASAMDEAPTLRMSRAALARAGVG